MIRKSFPAAKLTPESSLPAVWAGLMPLSCGGDADSGRLETQLKPEGCTVKPVETSC